MKPVPDGELRSVLVVVHRPRCFPPRRAGAASSRAGRSPQGPAPAAASSSPALPDAVIASLRFEAPSCGNQDRLRLLTVLREMNRRSPISRNVRCVRRSGSSATPRRVGAAASRPPSRPPARQGPPRARRPARTGPRAPAGGARWRVASASRSRRRPKDLAEGEPACASSSGTPTESHRAARG